MPEKAPSPRRAAYLRTVRREKRRVRIWQIALVAVLFAVWELSCRLGLSDGFLVSSPSRMVQTLWRLCASGELWHHAAMSIGETVLGFTAGTVLGTAIAVAMWWSDTAARILDPYLVVLNALPKTALGPIFIVWMGAGMGAIVTMTLAISLIVTILSMYTGFRTTDPEKLRLMRTLGADKRQILWLLVFPANCPTLFSTLKVNVGLSWVGVIMGEFLVSRAGLGYLIVYGSQVFNMDLVMASVVILAAAVWLYLSGSLTLANALMSVIISFLIFSQIQSAGSGVSALRLVGSSIDHANQVDGIPEMDQDGAQLHPEAHDIVFDHVDFSYGSRPILKDVSLTIPDRTTTAIVGPSGSGKTTLCNLIARFWDVDGGRVTIGGRDVREYTLESLMKQVSMVFQRVYLFHDTIENNIKFGCPNATHEQVMDAAKKACCHDFISALPEGYDTVIGESGATLSGGEKQRISIARCLLKDAPIVIFDEATANVDPENEDQLQKAMEALTREKTVLMIAHRLKTVRSADQILVLDQGRIVQRGTHGELIGQEGIYRNFVTQRAEAGKWSL